MDYLEWYEAYRQEAIYLEGIWEYPGVPLMEVQ